MAALHKKYIRERATEKENPDDEFFVKNCFVCGEVAKPNQVTISAAANGGADHGSLDVPPNSVEPVERTLSVYEDDFLSAETEDIELF